MKMLLTVKGGELREAREDMFLSRSALAVSAGVGISTIKRMESGGVTLAPTLRKVLNALGYGAEDAPRFSEQAEEPPPPLIKIDLQSGALTISETKE
jgi:predicted transcriptional regulator